MSDVPPASENGRSALPRCARVALAAVGSPGRGGLGLDRRDPAGRRPRRPGRRRRRSPRRFRWRSCGAWWPRPSVGNARRPGPSRRWTECVSRRPGPPVDGAAQCAVLDGAAGTLLWSGAGPRAPLVVGPDGGRLLAGGDGPALGRAHRRFRQAEETVEAGTTVVLGFPGAGDDLAARAARHHALAPDDLAAALLAGTGAGPAPVLLLARLIPAPLAERLPADPRRLPAVRRRLGAWSAQAALSDDTTADLQLMLSEAATNSVEHAYRDGPRRRVRLLRATARRRRDPRGGAGLRTVAATARGSRVPRPGPRRDPQPGRRGDVGGRRVRHPGRVHGPGRPAPARAAQCGPRRGAVVAPPAPEHAR